MMDFKTKSSSRLRGASSVDGVEDMLRSECKTRFDLYELQRSTGTPTSVGREMPTEMPVFSVLALFIQNSVNEINNYSAYLGGSECNKKRAKTQKRIRETAKRLF